MSESQQVKSVITCDLEGRIETFNDGAEQVFGYRADEVIGKKRVSLFSPGKVVLQYVPGWLKTAREQGEFESNTVFLRRDGTPIPAHVRITPTFRDGKQIGYCGVTEVLENVESTGYPGPSTAPPGTIRTGSAGLPGRLAPPRRTWPPHSR